MTEKTEALRLADALDYGVYDAQMARVMDKAAAELRRLAKVEDEWAALSQDQGKLESQIDRLVAQRDALLEALRTLLSYAFTLEMRLLDADGEHRAMQQARAAIAKAEEA